MLGSLPASIRRGRFASFAGVATLALVLAVPGMSYAQDPSRSPAATPPPPGPDASIHYVGVTDDPDVYVAVVTAEPGFVKVYLCDGADLGVWLEGVGTDAGADVTGADGSTGSVAIADGSASGSVTLSDGTVLTFTAAQASLPAGLYQAVRIEDGAPVVARTIVLPDGTAKGRKKSYDCGDSKKTYDVLIDNMWKAIGTDQFDTWATEAGSQRRTAEAAGCAWAQVTR